MDIEQMLEEFGCTVVGPAAKVSQALALVDAEHIDFALLDVNLGRERSFPIADRLASMNIPVLLSTGYANLEPPYDRLPKIQKPFSEQQLRNCLKELMASSAISEN
ncbi:MAG: response regulator [Paracoccus sp.]|nr:response regulator [Paracoccus sp. (in: a-proteobacteria)]